MGDIMLVKVTANHVRMHDTMWKQIKHTASSILYHPSFEG
jgi:hypothetical protein